MLIIPWDVVGLLYLVVIIPLSLLLWDATRSGRHLSLKIAAWMLVFYVWIELSMVYGQLHAWKAQAAQEATRQLDAKWAAIWAQVGPKIERAQPRELPEHQKWTVKRWGR